MFINMNDSHDLIGLDSLVEVFIVRGIVEGWPPANKAHNGCQILIEWVIRFKGQREALGS
jgi:hypothetical protein